MYRRAFEDFLAWKNRSKGTTSLLVSGARRVGKSYLVKEFAKHSYRTHIIIDFNKNDKFIEELFDNYLNDLNIFYFYLSSYFNVELYERKSLIVFDEVQVFPKARAALKYLVEDGRYDFIETGSLMSIKENVKDIVIPSEEDVIELFPMDFEEFLAALGDHSTFALLQHCFDEKIQVGQAIHRRIMTLFRQYLIVGGMPQAVKKYAETKSFEEVDIVKRRILNLYRNDIRKYAKGYEVKTTSLFDEIPAQLQKHEKKFKFASIEKNARFRTYQDPMFWLEDSMIVNNCYNSTEPTIGLKLKMDRMSMKCYMADTGLLISHAFDEKGIVSEEIYKKILFGKLNLNEGMLMENIVAQMLRTSGYKLFFFSSSSTQAKDRMEIDFLIAKSKVTSKHNITPIEVKSGKNYTLNSMNKFINKYSEQVATPIVIHAADYKSENGIEYLPIYMTPFL